MSISFDRYVKITSGVGGGAGVRERELILRLMTTSERVPAKSVLEFTSAESVGSYFGLTSPEYLRAVKYFGFISKNITRPEKISFGRWANVETAAKIFGARTAASLASLVAVSAGSFKLTLGSYTGDVTGINLTGAASLAAVATLLQTAVRAVVAGGVAWTTATVAYDAPSNSFNLTSGDPGPGAVAIAPAATGTPLAPLLGWTPSAVYSPGVDPEEPVVSFIDSVAATDNFGTFAFIPTLSDAQILAVATQNDTYNVRFHYTIGFDTEAEASTLFAALSGLSGVSWTYSPFPAEYHELDPAMILAATDYSKRNSVHGYMFQQFSQTPSVTTDAAANLFDATRANYYGRTQTAGQFIDFYQRGVMGGLATDPVDMNTYANEMWLKDAAGAQVMSLLLSLAKVSANEQGRSQLLAVIAPVIERATFNGTISIGKPLTPVQKLFIANLTGDENAWQQVFTLGYWFDIVLTSYVTTDGRTEWKAEYTLIYSKDDIVRKVEGTHALI